MNFKRPYWLLLVISLALAVLGFMAFLFSNPDVKGSSGSLWAIFIAGCYFLILFGAVGFVASIIWWLIDSSPRSRRNTG
jgi:hypothetical protein